MLHSDTVGLTDIFALWIFNGYCRGAGSIGAHGAQAPPSWLSSTYKWSWTEPKILFEQPHSVSNLYRKVHQNSVIFYNLPAHTLASYKTQPTFLFSSYILVSSRRSNKNSWRFVSAGNYNKYTTNKRLNVVSSATLYISWPPLKLEH